MADRNASSASWASPLQLKKEPSFKASMYRQMANKGPAVVVTLDDSEPDEVSDVFMKNSSVKAKSKVAGMKKELSSSSQGSSSSPLKTLNKDMGAEKKAPPKKVRRRTTMMTENN